MGGGCVVPAYGSPGARVRQTREMGTEAERNEESTASKEGNGQVERSEEEIIQ